METSGVSDLTCVYDHSSGGVCLSVSLMGQGGVAFGTWHSGSTGGIWHTDPLFADLSQSLYVLSVSSK
jgi:hypothetical protein